MGTSLITSDDEHHDDEEVRNGSSPELRPLKHAGMSSSEPHSRHAQLRSYTDESEPSLASLVMNRRFLLLAMVCIQNAGFSILRRYVTAVSHDQATTSSMLALGELIKLVTSFSMMLRDVRTVEGRKEYGSLFGFVSAHSSKMLVPASIFLCMNILGFISLAHIPAGLFAVLQQCKLITTAVLSRLLLSRQLSFAKWRALLLLLAGVVLITYEGNRMASEGASGRRRLDAIIGAANVTDAEDGQLSAGLAATLSHGESSALARAAARRAAADMLIGVSAVLLEALLSGFATVYFEKVLKSTPLTIWHRNVQLAAWSLLIFVPMAIYDSPEDPLRGWGPFELAIGVLGAMGGLLVALTIVEFDSVIKSVAVATSIVLTVLAGHILLAGPMSVPIVIASAIVITATIDYTFSP